MKRQNSVRGWRLRAGVAIAILAGTVAAKAASVPLYRSGFWTVEYTASNDNGSPMCILSDDLGPSAYFALKFQLAPQPALFGELGKMSWRIPKSRAISMEFQIDNDPPFNVSATGDGISLQWLGVGDGMRRFVREFKDGESMVVAFPDGDEPRWTISLDGSYKAADAFAACIANMPNTTQPYAPGTGREPGIGWNGPTG